MMGMGMGLPPAKAKDFRGSFRRLLGHLRPEWPRIVIVMLLAVVSVTFAVLGPKILGNAINVIFEGVFVPGAAIDMSALVRDPDDARRRVRPELALRLDPGLHHGRRHPAERPPPPRMRSIASSAGCRCATSTPTPAATS